MHSAIMCVQTLLQKQTHTHILSLSLSLSLGERAYLQNETLTHSHLGNCGLKFRKAGLAEDEERGTRRPRGSERHTDSDERWSG